MYSGTLPRMGRPHIADLITSPDPLSPRTALSVTQDVLKTLAMAPRFSVELWQDELRAISLAAAAAGDFGAAISGYKDLGKAAGLLTEKPAQHLHLYGADAAVVKEAPTASLEHRLAELRKQAAQPAPAAQTEEALIDELCA